MTVSTVAKVAAARGARLLDRKKKNWAQTVCVPELDMASGTHCILGYTYGPNNRVSGVFDADGESGFDIGVRRLFPETTSWSRERSNAITKFGFDCRSTLRKFWLIEIGKRLARLGR